MQMQARSLGVQKNRVYTTQDACTCSFPVVNEKDAPINWNQSIFIANLLDYRSLNSPMRKHWL